MESGSKIDVTAPPWLHTKTEANTKATFRITLDMVRAVSHIKKAAPITASGSMTSKTVKASTHGLTSHVSSARGARANRSRVIL